MDASFPHTLRSLQAGFRSFVCSRSRSMLGTTLKAGDPAFLRGEPGLRGNMTDLRPEPSSRGKASGCPLPRALGVPLLPSSQGQTIKREMQEGTEREH